MPAVKKYTRINFQNYPNTSTPLNATNLNKVDKGIDDLDDEVVTVKNAIENMSFDADSISYDNTSSGLQATDVQDAVDEINDNLAQTPITVGGETLSTIDDKLNYLVEKSGGLFSMQLGGGASVITSFNLTNSGISIPTHTTTKDDANSKDIFTIQGFSELSYIWTVPYSDRPIYLYVDDVLVDQLTTVASNVSRSYTLADTGLHMVEFRTRGGYASYSCNFLY